MPARVTRWPPTLRDGTFFIDLPGHQERLGIWELYIDRFGINPDQAWPRDEGWTGAKIRSACRLSALLDVPLVEAARNVVPVSVTASESVERLRNWASGRCLSADRPGIYVRNQGGMLPPGAPNFINPSMN